MSSDAKTAAPEMNEEEKASELPNMAIAHLIHRHGAEFCTDKEDVKKQLMEHIEKNNMAPLYESLCQQFSWTLDQALLDKMKKFNEEELKVHTEKHADAVENLGDTEILDALYGRANVFTRSGDKDGALAAYKEILGKEKAVSTGQRIQITLNTIRIGLFHSDNEIVKTNIAEAKKLVEAGGDWDRRNRLQVYEAVYLVMQRDLKQAAKLFLNSVATFTTYELCTFNELILYTVITSVLTLDRVDLRKKVVDSPEVLSAIKELPHLPELLDGLYHCNYSNFFNAMVELHPTLTLDRFFAPHVRYIIREFRILAYAQFLEAYKSVTLGAMAKAFGVSVDFCDKEVSRFIAAGRLHAKIDKTAGVIETNRPDPKTAHYKAVIKQGDLLLTQIQKFARTVNV